MLRATFSQCRQSLKSSCFQVGDLPYTLEQDIILTNTLDP
jgi:hypothetical protein